MKRFAPIAAIAVASLLLVSCSTSPIKRIVCTDEQGETLTGAIYDPERKVVYEYDHFTETLKPYEADDLYKVNEVAVTDSGKLKERKVMGDIALFGEQNEYDTVIDTKKLTAEITESNVKSKIKIGSSRADREHNSKVLESGDPVFDRTSTTETGTCKFVNPETTQIFGEAAK